MQPIASWSSLIVVLFPQIAPFSDTVLHSTCSAKRVAFWLPLAGIDFKWLLHCRRSQWLYRKGGCTELWRLWESAKPFHAPCRTSFYFGWREVFWSPVLHRTFAQKKSNIFSVNDLWESCFRWHESTSSLPTMVIASAEASSLPTIVLGLKLGWFLGTKGWRTSSLWV